MDKEIVERLQSYKLTIGATVENFLKNTGYNETIIEFLEDRKIEVIDLNDVYTFDPKVEN